MLSEVIWHTVAAEEREDILLCAGDMPIVLTQDGPSFGGFVCPCTITSTELWKMGQVSPNDRVQFKPTSLGEKLEVTVLTHNLRISQHSLRVVEIPGAEEKSSTRSLGHGIPIL